MNYLFFDIECCNGRNICSFGYVVVDEKFNLLKKKDIIINPEAKFKLGRNKFTPEVDLAYSQKDFKCHKNFAWYYNKIKAILTQKDIIILGHSVDNDIRYLDIACKRYKLPNININAYDTQNIYAEYVGNSRKLSLVDIATNLKISAADFYLHKSCDDAHLAMLITKNICEALDLGIKELLQLVEDARITNDLNSDKSIYKTNALKQLAAKYPKRKSWIAFCFSDTIKIDSFNVAKQLLDKGYNYINKVSECNYFVCGEGIGMRDLTCDDRIARGVNIKKISISEFEKLTNVLI